METEREDHPDRTHEDDALAGGDFTDELTEGQLDADAQSGSTLGTEDRATDAPDQGAAESISLSESPE